VTDCPVFRGCSSADIDEMLKVLKICDYKKGECICRTGEPIDMCALVCFGSLRVGHKAELTPKEVTNGQKIHKFKPGDMFGHQNFAEQSGPFME
jgi:CRP-like cAMP-binding protein